MGELYLLPIRKLTTPVIARYKSIPTANVGSELQRHQILLYMHQNTTDTDTPSSVKTYSFLAS